MTIKNHWQRKAKAATIQATHWLINNTLFHHHETNEDWNRLWDPPVAACEITRSFMVPELSAHHKEWTPLSQAMIEDDIFCNGCRLEWETRYGLFTSGKTWQDNPFTKLDKHGLEALATRANAITITSSKIRHGHALSMSGISSIEWKTLVPQEPLSVEQLEDLNDRIRNKK